MEEEQAKPEEPVKTGESEEKGKKPKKPGKFKKFLKIFITVVCILAILALVWIAFSLIGRVDAGSVIPDSEVFRVRVSNPVRLLDGLLSHEPLTDLTSVPALSQAAPLLEALKDNPLLKNNLVRTAISGKMEMAVLSLETGESIIAAWDTGFLSPLLRLLPVISGFLKIPNLYYVKAGADSRFEYRTENSTMYIGPYRNLLFVSNNSKIYESRAHAKSSEASQVFTNINPSDYDIALVLSDNFVNDLFAAQDPGIAAVLENLKFDSRVEAGISIFPRKFDLRLAAPLSSGHDVLSRFIDQRPVVPQMAEMLPAAAQYATVLSAGKLDDLFQATLLFVTDMDDTLRTADRTSRLLFSMTLNEVLFSWPGKEFAIFGMEGRPHPVIAIQVADERKRQEVFDKVFSSIFVDEDVRLNLDGTRIPRIAVPEFIQSVLRRWNIFLPSPYYYVYGDFLLISESADTLLSAIRSMQRNDVLPRTTEWRDIAGGKTAASAFSLYYSLDLSMPFFLRKNTMLSGFLSLYRQGYIRMSFDRGLMDLSISLIPGSGNGVILVNGYPMLIDGRPSNQVYVSGRAQDGRVFLSSGTSALSIDLSDNSIYTLADQGTHWVLPAPGTSEIPALNAWVVTDRGRVTLVDSSMEPLKGFPVILGLRLSSPPQVFEGRVYLSDEDGKVHVVDENGNVRVWETSFTAALRSPPSFIAAKGRNYSAVYPKSFFGEVWLLNAEGAAYPYWPASITVEDLTIPLNSSWWSTYIDNFVQSRASSSGAGIGFGSPLLFAIGNRVLVAFVCQGGELILYDEEAGYVSPFPILLDGVFYQQPVFDGDFLWLVSEEGTLFRVDLNGDVLYQNIPGFQVKEEGYITVFDSDGDGIPEIFITGEGNALHGFTRNFRSLEGFPLPVWGRPYFMEAQKPEIFGMGMDNRLYRWQFR